jgi:transcription initiation factor TFIID subunit 13
MTFRTSFDFYIVAVARIMYGSGDARVPLRESVQLIEELVTQFIVDMTRKAASVTRSGDRLHKEDLLFAIRDHPRMYARAQELLQMRSMIQQIRNEEKSMTAEGRVRHNKRAKADEADKSVDGAAAAEVESKDVSGGEDDD